MLTLVVFSVLPILCCHCDEVFAGQHEQQKTQGLDLLNSYRPFSSCLCREASDNAIRHRDSVCRGLVLK